jgi:hypothetical protein
VFGEDEPLAVFPTRPDRLKTGGADERAGTALPYRPG